MAKIVQLGVGDSVTLVVRATRAGKPDYLPTLPSWSVSDPLIASIAPEADGLSCVVTAVASGSTKVTCDSAPLSVVQTIEVLASGADALVLSVI